MVRPLEMVVVVLGSVAAAGMLVPRLSKNKELCLYPSIVAMLATVAHQVIEGTRWHMGPVYVLIVLLVGVALKRSARIGREGSSSGSRFSSKAKAVLFGGAAALLLGVGVVLMLLFPVVHLPDPTGPYAVGTTYLEFVDSSRTETLTDDPIDLREFSARVWYPAELDSGEDPMPYIEYTAPVGSLEPGAPAIAFSHLKLSRSNSHLNARIAEGNTGYPILLVSVGFLAGYEDHQLAAEELASNGFVVLSFTNPYESASVVRPDGTVVPFSAEHGENYEQHMNTTMPLWAEFWGSDDTTVTYEVARRILASENFMDNVLRIRVADLRYAIGELERMNVAGSGSLFSAKLDLTRIGVFGHSMGGAVAGQLCLVDDRVKAGVNLDGFQFGDVVTDTIEQPFMTAYSEAFEGANDFILGNFGDMTYVLTIAGSTHMNFSDWPVILPLTRRLGMAGPIEPARAAEITNAYLLAFFDRHLRGVEPPLLERSASPYPEVHIEVRTP